jgi:hypothetical protein
VFIQDGINKLVYIKSTNIKVFPCGRRRSELVDSDGSDNTVSDRSYIPIDPEARLNTEANNRKHSGLNGFKQTYINDWEQGSDSISLVLAGYLFNITLDSEYRDIKNFGNAIKGLIGDTDSIYANIVLADVQFFSSVDGSGTPGSTVSTEILRDQALALQPSVCLDILKEGGTATRAADYYFSGLSFSSEESRPTNDRSNQRVISLQLLDYNSDTDFWAVHAASRLPKIDHGDTENSVKLVGDLNLPGTLTVDEKIVAGSIDVNKKTNDDGTTTTIAVAALKVDQTDSGAYQLKFYT